MQVVHYKQDVFRSFANFEERSLLSNGQAVVRPYRSNLAVSTYTRGSDATIQDTTDTSETLTVNQSKIVGFSVDDLDALQSNYKLQAEYSRDAAKLLGNQIDGDVLSAGIQASGITTIDASTFGGTAGAGIVLSTANVEAILFKAGQKLNENNIDISDRYGVLSPQFQNALQGYYSGRETVGGDKTGDNGYIGTKANFDLMMSNNLTWVGVLSIATTPTDGDTVTINGVTFTFKTTLGSTPGNVAIGGSADAARLNLTELINSPLTTDAGQVALTAANAALLYNITAVDSASGNTMTVTAVGKSYLSPTETLTDGTDKWTSGIQYQLFGRKRNIDCVIQAEPTVKVNQIPKQLGVYVLPYTLYGVKAFREGVQSSVRIAIDSTVF
jgi:hypothetical protein